MGAQDSIRHFREVTQAASCYSESQKRWLRCCLAFPPEHAVLLCVKAGHAFVYAVPAGEEPQAPSFSFPLSSCGAAADPKRWGASGWGVALENKRGEPEYSVVFEKEADADEWDGWDGWDGWNSLKRALVACRGGEWGGGCRWCV